jgi:hypothetical protein
VTLNDLQSVHNCARFETFTLVVIQVVFWVMTPRSVVVGYERRHNPEDLDLHAYLNFSVVVVRQVLGSSYQEIIKYGG